MIELNFDKCRQIPLADGTLSGVKDHVKVGVKALCERPFFFLADSMGLMKSAQTLIAAQFLYEADIIDKILIVAPASVRGVWYDEELGELKKHLWTPALITEFHARTRHWLHEVEGIERGERRLEITVTNYEFLVSKNRLRQALDVCGRRTLLVGDESAYLKSHDSARTKAFAQLRNRCGRVVLLNGTPIAHSPLDLFSQGNILHPSVHGLKYITHFKSRYATEEAVVGFGGKALTKTVGKGRFQKEVTIQHVVGWRNLDHLTRCFAPYVLRREKKDCLDLPPALPPVSYEVPLADPTWRIYREMRDEFVVWLKSGVAVSATAAVKAMRLSQITSGFLGGIEDPNIGQDDDESSGVIESLDLPYATEQQGREVADHMIAQTQDVDRRAGRSPIVPIGREKLDFALGLHREWLEADLNLKLIVWCRFRAELERMMQDVEAHASRLGYGTLHDAIDVGQIHGGQKRGEREAALRLLDPRTAPPGPVFFGGTYGTGALGINLTACHVVINMSFDYSLWKAQQTAARVDRPGQVHAVSYYDIIATGPRGQRTIDHAIIAARRAREDVARWTTDRWLKTIAEE